MADFEANLNGADNLDDALGKLQAKLKDLRPIWPQVATVFHQAMRKQFASQGAYASQGWAKLSPAYATWKERAHPGLPIGELHGVMKASLVDAFGNSDSIYEVTADTLRIGTRTPYARYFHYGTSKMPARTLIALTEQDKAQMVKIIRDALGNEAVKLGFRVTTR